MIVGAKTEPGTLIPLYWCERCEVGAKSDEGCWLCGGEVGHRFPFADNEVMRRNREAARLTLGN